MTDHVHLLASFTPAVSIPQFVSYLKSNSARFFQQTLGETLIWQEGYGIFSVSYNRITSVKNYIANQEKHHQDFLYEEEFAFLLKEQRILHDKAIIFD